MCLPPNIENTKTNYVCLYGFLLRDIDFMKGSIKYSFMYIVHKIEFEQNLKYWMWEKN